MQNRLAQDRPAGSPLSIATTRLAKDVRPDRMVAMLDELGVQNSWNVVEDAGRIVVEARQDFNRSRKTEMRKAAIIAAVGTVIALLGIYALFGTVADDTIATVTTAVGGVVAYRGFKRRDQLGRQSFRNSFRFSS